MSLLASLTRHEQITNLSRPFAATQKYASGNFDPQTAGRELGVGTVVTGHFSQEGERLRVTLEAVDVEGNRLLWRDSVSGVAQDMIALHEQITAQCPRCRPVVPPPPCSPLCSGNPNSGPPRSCEIFRRMSARAVAEQTPRLKGATIMNGLNTQLRGPTGRQTGSANF